MTSKLNDKISNNLLHNFSSGLKVLKDELTNNTKLAAQEQLHQLNLVSREEFDIQRQVLLRSRQKISELEAKVKTLEEQVAQLI